MKVNWFVVIQFKIGHLNIFRVKIDSNYGKRNWSRRALFYLLKHCSGPAWSQFHQHFTQAFSYKILAPKITKLKHDLIRENCTICFGTKKVCVKCWWHWTLPCQAMSMYWWGARLGYVAAPSLRPWSDVLYVPFLCYCIKILIYRLQNKIFKE